MWSSSRLSSKVFLLGRQKTKLQSRIGLIHEQSDKIFKLIDTASVVVILIIDQR